MIFRSTIQEGGVGGGGWPELRSKVQGGGIGPPESRRVFQGGGVGVWAAKNLMQVSVGVRGKTQFQKALRPQPSTCRLSGASTFNLQVEPG